MLHCVTYGGGSPTVVLVSGLDSPQDNWNTVVPGLARHTTVVTFDRAGIGKSELGILPADGEQSAKDLRALLGALAVPRPYILVGHSLGGFIVRIFAFRYPADVAGLILEEVQHEEMLTEMRRILDGKDRESFERVLAPRFAAPDNPKTESDFRNVTREQARRATPLPRVPFIVLTVVGRAKAMQPLFSDRAIEELAKADAALMDRLVASIPGGRQIMVEGTGHYIHIDKPDALVVPVVEMIQRAREKRQD